MDRARYDWMDNDIDFGVWVQCIDESESPFFWITSRPQYYSLLISSSPRRGFLRSEVSSTPRNGQLPDCQTDGQRFDGLLSQVMHTVDGEGL